MSEHVEHAEPFNSAKLLLPVVILGMLALMTIMYFAGGNNFVREYHKTDGAPATHATESAH